MNIQKSIQQQTLEVQCRIAAALEKLVDRFCTEEEEVAVKTSADSKSKSPKTSKTTKTSRSPSKKSEESKELENAGAA